MFLGVFLWNKLRIDRKAGGDNDEHHSKDKGRQEEPVSGN